MDEELKKKAYPEAMRLKNAGHDSEIIRARLDKMGIPEEMIASVIKNLTIQQKVDAVKEQTPFYNIALIRVGVGIGLAIVSFIALPDVTILPIGLIVGGIVAAVAAKSKM